MPPAGDAPTLEPQEDDDEASSRAMQATGRGFSVWAGEPVVPAPPPPPRPPSGSQGAGQWKVWGGKATTWITYPAEVQQLLNSAWYTGETVRVTLAGNPYSINVAQGWQNREDTYAPVRKVRWIADGEE